MVFGSGLSALTPVPVPELAAAERRLSAQRVEATTPGPLLAGIKPPALAASETAAGSGTALFGVVPGDAVPAVLAALATA